MISRGIATNTVVAVTVDDDKCKEQFSNKKRKRMRLEVTKARILDKKSRPPGMPPCPVSLVAQSQSTLSMSPDAVLGVGRNLTLVEPPNLRASPSSHAHGCPLADAAAIADMTCSRTLLQSK